ncbi:MAG: TetR/AcrR family transcriptional regulator [Flavobacteriales bacterium]|jgi:AcrR family transcriptional regulator|nr:TetR/AcrR family transcriptional regulator [Flavobacteriales bacterium]
MKNTKKEILNTARKLFNKYGYSDVTIRMIAQELSISSGNLNYHYKKREAIFEALYFEMVADFDQRIDDLPTTEFSVEQVKSDIHASMVRMLDYTFFWTDIYRLIEVSDKVKKHFLSAYKQRIEGCHFLFNELKKQGLMNSNCSKEELDYLAERMVHYGNTWLYASRLYSKNITTKDLNHFVEVYLSMLKPFLIFSKVNN